MSKKRKIIFLGPVPPPFMGPTVATQVLLNSKLKEMFTLIHLDTSDHRELSTLGAVDLPNIFLALKHYLILFILLLYWWPDLVYIPISQTTLGYIRDSIFIIISKIFRKKVVCHLRGGNFKNWFYSASNLTKWYVRHVHSLVDGQIVLGKNLVHLFQNIISEEKIFVVPNGKNVDISVYDKKCSDKIKILFLSNFIKEKGILDVLKSIIFVCQYDKDVEFIFGGSWHDKQTNRDYENFIRKHPNLSICMKGPVIGKAKYELLFSSDIFVFPTYYPLEGHPWVIVEAMAAGLPIISCDQGAITESVLDCKNGYIVPKRNPEQVAKKIIKLIDDEEMRKKMGEESRKLYLENFTEDKMVEKLVLTFEKVLCK